MAMNDLLSDMLTRIRNGQKARLHTVDSYYSKLLANVCEVLVEEGYITGYEKTGTEAKPALNIELKYYEDEPVIKTIKRVSKPGRREYCPVSDLPKVNNGLGISIITTSAGVMSDAQARQKNVSGEILCEVF
ncbi:MAG: 30S ribosomal protein S8 [Rickettsiales bacterium]|nr:30S ribosomal protein S8 [Rickettsiales bacterium]